MSKFCINCGKSLPDETVFCSYCGIGQSVSAPLQQGEQQHYAPPIYNAPQSPPQPKKINLGIIAAITAAAVVAICVGSYFLFFAGKQPTEQTAMATPVRTAVAIAEPTDNPSAANGSIKKDATLDDIAGAWEGEMRMTRMDGFDKLPAEQLPPDFEEIIARILSTPAAMELEIETDGNWNLNVDIEAGLSLSSYEFDSDENNKTSPVLLTGLENGSFDVAYSEEIDENGIKGTSSFALTGTVYEDGDGLSIEGTLVFSAQHGSVSMIEEGNYSVALHVKSDTETDTATDDAQLSANEAGETVSAQTINVDIAYDSGEGIYTGEVKDGVPNGRGSFEMVTSDNGNDWSYEGQWENGDIIGEGVMIQGNFVFTGGFRGGLLNGTCEIRDNGVLRYQGMCQDGMLHGQGTLYTKSGTLIFEGMFENDMRVESEADKQTRGEAFIPECADMEELLYDGCIAEDNTFDYPVAVWGFPIAMGEQTANGTIVIGHMADDAYPICLNYRYGVGETKMTVDDWINAWGVVVGTYEYENAEGIMVTCPMVEVIYWNNEQEGL